MTMGRPSLFQAIRPAFRLSLMTITVVGLLSVLTAPSAAGEDVLQPRPSDVEVRNGSLTFEEVHVQVWPEYDRPAVLVLVELILPGGAELPQGFDLALPKGAEVTALGEVDEAGSYTLAEAPPQVDRSGGEWDVARLEFAGTRQLRLEYYYDPGLSLEGTRAFDFRFEFPGSAVTASLAVQQPARSTDFQIEPPLDALTDDVEGFTYAVQQNSNVRAGDRYAVRISYEKPDAQASVDPAQAQQPPSEGASPGGEGNNGRQDLYLVLAVVGIASVGAGLWALRARRHADVTACEACGAESANPDAEFCVECGHRLP